MIKVENFTDKAFWPHTTKQVGTLLLHLGLEGLPTLLDQHSQK
jgi:hypothetical protein